MADMNEYTDAWTEGEENQPAENAVAAAKKKADISEKGEYITAYADLDSGQSVNGEDLKNVKLKDKTQEAGNIAANHDEGEDK